MSSHSPPRSPPTANADNDADSFGRSTRSQIRLKVKHSTRGSSSRRGDADRGGDAADPGDDDEEEELDRLSNDGLDDDPSLYLERYRDYPDGHEDPADYDQGGAADPQGELGQDVEGEDEEFLTAGRVRISTPTSDRDWDDSEDESDEEDEENEDGDGSAAVLRRRAKAQHRHDHPHSYLRTLTPSRRRTWSFWLSLTNPGAPNTLSAPHVSLNLFSASLHPSVLLSMPVYFDRTGTTLGLVGLIAVGVLGGVGGGLWVVLSRYVGGKKTVEAITGASFGKNTKWKGRFGKAVAGSMLAAYATGAAFIAYFAIADLLLQVFFHYAHKGLFLHDRGFVTLVVGGFLTAPLIIVPLHKRTLIRLATGTACFLYPILITILLVKIYTIDVTQLKTTPSDTAQPGLFMRPDLPNGNPLYPPSIWAPYSLLPLLTLSSSPLQILAHNRSLRRKASRKAAQDGSNVKAFLAAQAGQVVLVVGVAVAFGIGMGTKGVIERLGMAVHPNLFFSLPRDDHLINFARLLFVILLSTHMALCLAVARSSWARLLKLFNLNPLKWRRRRSGQVDSASSSTRTGRIRLEGEEGVTPSLLESRLRSPSAGSRTEKWSWSKLARTSLGGVLLWLLVASLSYISGIGGLHKSERKGEEARFTRSSEVLGLLGGGVGFVLPGLVWIILLHLRRPRGILPEWIGEGLAKGWKGEWVRGPLGALTRSRRRGGANTEAANASASITIDEAGPAGGDVTRPVPTWHEEQRMEVSAGGNPPEDTGGDEATRILLARKERQLQKRTKERRLWQDILVLAAVLPFGIVLLVMGAIELSKGGY